MSDAPIPLAKPSFDESEERLLLEALRSGWVTQGPRVAEFERLFAERVGAREAVAVSNCSAALFLALRVHGIGPGDEVIVPSLTFIATANAVELAGATPVFVDVEPRTYNVDPDEVELAITDRTRAVIPVDQVGLPVDLGRIEALAREHGLAVVEDAACAVGSRWRGEPIGSRDHLACFSFHPRKVLVTGEGGMITTPDPDQAVRLRRLRHQGMSISDLERHQSEGAVIEEYPEIGYNFRMSDLQAAVGIAQLAKLDEFLARRRALAARYDACLADFPEAIGPAVPEGSEPNYQSYIVRLRGFGEDRRDRVVDALQRSGVGSRRGLMASHLEPAWATGARRAGSLRHTEEAAADTLLLPLFTAMTDEQQDRVLQALRSAIDASAEAP